MVANDKEDWIDLSHLPKHGSSGISAKKSVGNIVKFKCGEVEGELKLLSYDKNDRSFSVDYNGEIKRITTNDLFNCRLKTLTNQITKEYKHMIGDIVGRYKILELTTKGKDRKRAYLSKCLDCGHEQIRIHRELESSCCVCVKKSFVVEGVNDCLTTHPFIKKYVVDSEQLKLVTSSSPRKIECKCPICHTKKMCSPWEIRFNGFACKRCGDGQTFPEKIIGEMLRQLKIDFIPQASKKTLHWCENYRYDFYLPKYNTIIEAHGEQHYIDYKQWTKLTLEQIQENDSYKETIATSNGISKYIVLDCRVSEMDWIRNSIMTSELPRLLEFDIDDIDWGKCLKYINTPVITLIVDLWNNGMHSTVEIGQEVGLAKSTVRRYLKIANELKLCEYNTKIVNEYKARKISNTRAIKKNKSK